MDSVQEKDLTVNSSTGSGAARQKRLVHRDLDRLGVPREGTDGLALTVKERLLVLAERQGAVTVNDQELVWPSGWRPKRRNSHVAVTEQAQGEQERPLLAA